MLSWVSPKRQLLPSSLRAIIAALFRDSLLGAVEVTFSFDGLSILISGLGLDWLANSWLGCIVSAARQSAKLKL